MFNEVQNNVVIKNEKESVLLNKEDSLHFLNQVDDIYSNNIFNLEKAKNELEKLINEWLEGVDYEY